MKKTSLWLMISTLVLCLGVMITGVYSAISAQLNIGGTLGFNMHDCMITVSGTIQNVAVSTDNWVTAEPTTLNIERTVMGGESTTTTNMNLDPLYFYTGDMIFEFTFTNIHTKPISATIPVPTVDGTAVIVLTGTANDYTNFTDENNTYIAKLPVGSSTTVTFALRLKDTSTLFEEVSFNWTNITFEEREEELYYIDEDGRLAVNMGHATPTDVPTGYEDVAIEWFAFAVRGEGNDTDGYLTKPNFVSSYENNAGLTQEQISARVLNVPTTGTKPNENWYSLYGVDMTNVDYTGKTFWFIQKYVAAGGYDDADDNWISGQIFDNNFIHEYDISDIYTYLTTSESTGYLSQTGISSTDYYTSSITDRRVPETCEVNGALLHYTFTSKLWFISQAELGLLVGKTVTGYGTDVGMTCGIGMEKTCICDVGAGWWLRSGVNGYDGYVMCVSNDGSVDMAHVEGYFDCNFGVRAAFEISIPA